MRFPASPGETKRILSQYGLTAKKRYGQNFLIREEVTRAIVDAAGVTKEDGVLEIGPGIGTMTVVLSEAAERVLCVEIDKKLEPVLEDVLDGCGNVHILWQDVLKTDIAAALREAGVQTPCKVVANLPYYVTTPILMELLQDAGLFKSITLLVQREVAERICAEAGTKAYGAITPAVLYYAEPQIVADVPPEAFLPRPEVVSSILHLTMRDHPPVEGDKEAMFALIRAAFNQRRKTLSNALSHGLPAPYAVERGRVTDALRAMGLPEDIRGEKLDLAAFAKLSRLLFEKV